MTMMRVNPYGSNTRSKGETLAVQPSLLLKGEEEW